jgi:hypothetical protein
MAPQSISKPAAQRFFCVFLFACVTAVFHPTTGFAQYDYPWFSVSPSTIQQGECYYISVANWPNQTLAVAYYKDGAGPYYIYGWPSLDNYGNSIICTDAYTALGTYTFVSTMNYTAGQWWNVNGSVTVTVPQPQYPQPTSLSFSPGSGYAGNDCYVITLGNSAGMTVDLYYTFNSQPPSTFTAQMNNSGQWSYCLAHYDRVGLYTFSGIKNHSNSDWFWIAPVTYRVNAPQPTSLWVSPAAIKQTTPYTIGATNGGNVVLDVQYMLNDGAVQTLWTWPSLAPTYAGSPDGSTMIPTDASTQIGKYLFTAARNTANTAWVPTTTSLWVCPPVAPSITSVNPSAAPAGSTGTITISGTNICPITVSGPGVTFTKISPNNTFTSLTAEYTVVANTAPGTKTLQLVVPGGASATSSFIVTGPSVLSKEYIYLGDRVISTIAP